MFFLQKCNECVCMHTLAPPTTKMTNWRVGQVLVFVVQSGFIFQLYHSKAGVQRAIVLV